MPLKKDKNHKLYYSIKEVAAEFGVSDSLLRYWEKEFPHLRPKTTANGVRQYTQKDIDQLRVIYSLVKVRGFKLAAARKMLNKNPAGAEKDGRHPRHAHLREGRAPKSEEAIRRSGVRNRPLICHSFSKSRPPFI